MHTISNHCLGKCGTGSGVRHHGSDGCADGTHTESCQTDPCTACRRTLCRRGITYVQRGGGKKLAAVGPFNAHHNPAFLLQCMQKLHYLDADYRLYLAGEFEDKALSRIAAG